MLAAPPVGMLRNGTMNDNPNYKHKNKHSDRKMIFKSRKMIDLVNHEKSMKPYIKYQVKQLNISDLVMLLNLQSSFVGSLHGRTCRLLSVPAPVVNPKKRPVRFPVAGVPIGSKLSFPSSCSSRGALTMPLDLELELPRKQ